MNTLVIHTPKPTDTKGNRSFEDTIKTLTGEQFAIYASIFDQIHEGMPLIILDKRKKKQVRAIVTRLEFQLEASNRVPRYNVLFRNPVDEPYRGHEIRLNRCGVTLL